jgi:hypothetical protein
VVGGGLVTLGLRCGIDVQVLVAASAVALALAGVAVGRLDGLSPAQSTLDIPNRQRPHPEPTAMKGTR